MKATRLLRLGPRNRPQLSGENGLLRLRLICARSRNGHFLFFFCCLVVVVVALVRFRLRVCRPIRYIPLHYLDLKGGELGALGALGVTTHSRNTTDDGAPAAVAEREFGGT